MFFLLPLLLFWSSDFDDKLQAGLDALSRNDLPTAAAQLEAATKLQPENAEAWLAEHTREAPPKRVRHAKFGEGDVVALEGTGDQAKLVIDFADGRKTLLRRFVVVIA